jgi:UDP-N-acetyl-D-galactosamine dehydrogenase
MSYWVRRDGGLNNAVSTRLDIISGEKNDRFVPPSDVKIGVIGLGYVGFPLALAFKDHYRVAGYDSDKTRVRELMDGIDRNDEVLLGQGRAAVCRVGSDDLEKWLGLGDGGSGLILGDGDVSILPALRSCNVFVIAVPTGVDKSNTPDKKPLMEASILAGSMLKPGDTVIYESTVYPGCTEEFCVPILEQVSGLKLNEDFFVGYSPERINPGDDVHRLQTIVKLTSGSTPKTAEFVDGLYRKIVQAGTFKAANIKTAEASKIMENIQRDVNIAFMNEMTVLFNSLGLRMDDILAAARTRWNFVPFTPGLVGGHCVGVDPYWLLWKAKESGVSLDLVESARERNESMPLYLAEKILKGMTRKGITPDGADVLVLGFTFKENCPDCRNTKVFPLVKELESAGCRVLVCDPRADKVSVLDEYGVEIFSVVPYQDERNGFDAVIGAVAHREFAFMNPEDYLRKNGIVFDIKNVFKKYAGGERL